MHNDFWIEEEGNAEKKAKYLPSGSTASKINASLN
jgi:hypothetical protein